MKRKKIDSFFKKDFYGISLILILILFRIIPHPPNFTPIIAIAIMSGYFFRNFYIAIIILVSSMFISDLYLGLSKHIIFTYGSLLFINIIFFNISQKINYKNLFLCGFIGSLIFYLISNFGVWLMGSMYEKSLSGLIECYLMAIPFFRNTLLSTLLFSYAAFFVFNYNLKFFSKNLFNK